MAAPEWYRTARSPFLSHVPPPPLPGMGSDAPAEPGDPSFGQRQLPKVPALPTLPGGRLQPKIAAPKAPPSAFAKLPPPPAPPPRSGPPPSTPPTTVAVQASGDVSAPRRSGPVGAMPKKRIEEDVAFIIPGLQDRAFTEDEVDVAFQMMDIDLKDYLSKQDLRRVINLVGDGDVPDPELNEMIRLVSEIRDVEVQEGDEREPKVTFEEFRQFFQDPPLLFRNFDLHRRAGLAADNADSHRRMSSYVSVTSAASKELMIGDDTRGEATGHLAALCCAAEKITPDFVKQVYRRFVEADLDHQGFVTFEAFCLACVPHQQRPRRGSPEESALQEAFDAFDVDSIGEVDLRLLVVGMSMFSDAPLQARLRFAFMMFDDDRVGSLTRRDLLELFRAVSPYMVESQCEKHVNRIYAVENLHEHGRVTEEALTNYIVTNIGAFLRNEVRVGSKSVAIMAPGEEFSSRTPSRRTASGLPSALASRGGSRNPSHQMPIQVGSRRPSHLEDTPQPRSAGNFLQVPGH